MEQNQRMVLEDVQYKGKSRCIHSYKNIEKTTVNLPQSGMSQSSQRLYGSVV